MKTDKTPNLIAQRIIFAFRTLTDSGFLWFIIRWSVFRTITTRDNEPQSCEDPTVGIFGTSVITALIGLRGKQATTKKTTIKGN